MQSHTCSPPMSVQAGYSSVGRASDCRILQQSDGPWFDSGWPDLYAMPESHKFAVAVLLWRQLGIT